MEAIKLMEQWWGFRQRLFTYSEFCFDHPISTIICHDFWIWTVIGSFGLALLIVFVIGKNVIREQLEYYRNRKRLEARKIVANKETMDQYKWVGDSNAAVDLSQEELAAALRAGIEQKKAN